MNNVPYIAPKSVLYFRLLLYSQKRHSENSCQRVVFKDRGGCQYRAVGTGIGMNVLLEERSKNVH